MTSTTNIRTKQKKFALEKALQSMDPFKIREAIELPPLAPPGTKASTGVSIVNDVGGGGGGGGKRGVSLQDANGFEWGPVLVALLDASDAALAGDAIKCYKHQAALHSSLNHIFSSSPGNILVPCLHAVCRNTHRTALQADDAAATSGGRNDRERLQGAVTLLQESFSKTLNDRREIGGGGGMGAGQGEWSVDGSKKVGVLYIVNWLFAMYFRLNTLRLCKNLLRPVESRQLHEKGTMGDMVTYRYYVGRLNMFEDQYESAEINLEYALTHCHVNAKANKKRILNYLLPVKLLRGRLPSDYLLQKYSLTEFKPIIEGIRRGDLRTFNSGLDRHQDLFIRRGTYLLLEKCKTVCYRNLFKRVYLVKQKTQIRLQDMVKALKWLGTTIDLDEVECVLANLIFSGKVRGYISHEKRVLVLSKKDPFPTGVIIPK